MKRNIIVTIVILIILGLLIVPHLKREHQLQVERAEALAAQTVKSDPVKTKTEQTPTPAVETPKVEAVAEPAPVAVVDPNGCEAKGMHYRADNNECIPNPAPAVATASTAGSGSCEAEIAKYNWSQGVALAVARAESGLNPANVNNNPATGDYSVGCFQINIYGANAYSRPSEAELKNAATNVAWAYRIYTGNGNSFIGQWGVCRSKVACY